MYLLYIIFVNRDVRRLVVAMSRARLGLYIFARVSLFSNCFELTPAFQYLMVRPLQLRIIPSERYPPKQERAMKLDVKVIKDMTHMHQYVYDMYIKIVQDMNRADAKKDVIKKVSNIVYPQEY